MKKFLFSILFGNCLNFIHSQPNFQWVKSTEPDAVSIVHDASGNIITAGTFSNTIDLDPGPGTFTLSPFNFSDCFICKLDAAGNFIWAKQLNATQALMNTVTTDPAGNIYATGGMVNGSSYDSFVWKLDPSGNTIWNKLMGGSNTDNGIDIDVDPFGNVYTSGAFYSTDADFDPGPATFTLGCVGWINGYISKLDPAGNFIWAKQIINSSTTYLFPIWSLRTDNAGNVYYAGEFAGTTDFDPSPATYILSAAGSSRDGFIAKLDAAGNFAWAGAIGSLKDDGATKLRKGSNDIYLLGVFDSIVDLDPGPGTYTLDAAISGGTYLMKLNTSGNMMWAKTIFPYVRGLTLDASENIYATGSFYVTSDLDPGPASFTLGPTSNWSASFISKLDSAGNFKWAGQLQDTGYHWLGDITVDLSNNIYAIGGFLGKVDFDPGPLTSTLAATGANLQPFILKLYQGSVGVNENQFSPGISLYPNPTSGQISFLSDKTLKYLKLKLFSLTGSILIEKEILFTEKTIIDLSGYSDGVYILQMDTDGYTFRTKVIKN